MGISNIYAVVPAYNEQNSIGNIVKKTKKYTDNVIVVDDGSKDRTKEMAEKAGYVEGKVYTCERLIDVYGQNGGLEEAVWYARQGLNSARLVWGYLDSEGKAAGIIERAKKYSISLDA